MKSTKNQKGFTLIELLVVIAIIGILASVVLASLNTARNKGGDAAVKSNLANLRPQAELYYSDNNQSYTGICSDTKFNSGVTAAAATCIMTADTWAVSAPLKTNTNTSWCVDSTGKSSLGTANGTTGLCDASGGDTSGGNGGGSLTWASSDGPSGHNWYDAGTYCSGLGGWRLPSKNELVALFNLTRSTPSGFTPSYYWSSTTVPSTSTDVYVVNMGDGSFVNNNKSGGVYLRCVQ